MENKVCTQCSIQFACTADEACWCTKYPRLRWSAPEDSCFCPSCLITAMAQQINAASTLPDKKLSLEIASLGPAQTLQEGTDYTMNDQGLMILSRWYLLRRGHCCDNGCHQCPYPNEHNT